MRLVAVPADVLLIQIDGPQITSRLARARQGPEVMLMIVPVFMKEPPVALGLERMSIDSLDR
jgi:hypothetical protein